MYVEPTKIPRSASEAVQGHASRCAEKCRPPTRAQHKLICDYIVEGVDAIPHDATRSPLMGRSVVNPCGPRHFGTVPGMKERKGFRVGGGGRLERETMGMQRRGAIGSRGESNNRREADNEAQPKGIVTMGSTRTLVASRSCAQVGFAEECRPVTRAFH